MYSHEKPHRTFINHDARRKIVDSPLTLIVMIRHGACHVLFRLSWRPILSVCIKTAKSVINYLPYKTKNRWHSVDMQFQKQAGSVSLSLLPIKEACMSFMNGSHQSWCRVTMMHSHKLLTHSWHTFSEWAWSVSLSLLVINAAYTSFMNVCIQLPLRIPNMQDQKSLTCRWVSFSRWGR